MSALDVQAAHGLSDGSGVTVAVIDTGIDKHPDLSDNLLPGAVFDPNMSGDGRSDSDGHGTSMGGIIAGHGRQSSGVLGLAPRAKLLPVIDGRSSARTEQDQTALAVKWAVDHGAVVINISGGGGPSPQLRVAIQRAIDADVVVVAAAGNRPAEDVNFPARYPGVVAVGATDREGNVADISVTGKAVVITAPGVDIVSTAPGGRYSTGTGTSDATAIVSGAVALIRSRFPDLSAEEVVHRLTATATDKGQPGRDDQYGYGVLNLMAALTADVPPLAATPTATDAANPTPTSADAAPRQPADDGAAVSIALAMLAVVGGGVAWFAIRARRRRPG